MNTAINIPKVYTKSSFFKETNKLKRTVHIPAANIDENDAEYILSIAAPGFNKENFLIHTEKDLLSITAAKEISESDCVQDRCEYDFSCWKREFTLPADADALLARAKYKNGELIIRIPKGVSDSTYFSNSIYVY